MSEEKVPYLDLRDPVAIQLERMAAALEEQNRINREWLEVNRAWRKENNENDVSQRIVAIHEENAKRDQALREEVRKQAERQARVADEIVRASYEAYLESLKNPSKELVQAVQTALAEDIRQNPAELGSAIMRKLEVQTADMRRSTGASAHE